MFKFWRTDEPASRDNMAWTAVEDDLSEEDLQIIERGGARIYSSHHRPQPSVVSSATSSAASVATSGGSTTALIRHPRRTRTPRFWQKPRVEAGEQKERNLLLTIPAVPTITAAKPKEQEMTTYSEVKQEEPVSPSATVDIPTPASTNYIPQILAATSVSLGSMMVGFASSYSSPATTSLNLDPKIGPITDLQKSWIGSLLPLFAIFGGLLGGPAIDKLGRRTTILFMAPPFFISFLLIAFAKELTMIYIGRSVAGVCTGIITLALPVYLGETIQSEVRGNLGLLPTTIGNLGLLLCYIGGSFLNWSQLALMGAIIPIPFFICMMLIPETPRWYLSNDKRKRARLALQWLRGRYTDISQEFNELEKSQQEAQLDESTAGITELFAKRYRKPIFISLGLMLFQQMSGINAVMFYNKHIFEMSGSTINPNWCSIIIGLVNLGTVFVSSTLIDRLGRKILLYVSSVLMIISITPLGIYFVVKDHTNYSVDHLGWIPLVCFVIYIIGFSIGFGPVPWLMMGEILPAKIRGSGASIATSFNWLTTFIVTKTFGGGLSYGILFLTYGGCCCFALVFVMLFVPETQGRSLEDIERNLKGEGPKIPVRTARRMSSIANLKPTPISI